MSYKNDSEIVILNRYSKASSMAKAELFETYDRLRDLSVSGPSLGGSGLGKFASFLMSAAQMLGAAPFMPTYGNESINIPGTSYYSPITGGTGIVPGGQAAFGLAPYSQFPGLPSGAAAPVDAAEGSAVASVPLATLGATGAGSSFWNKLGFAGFGSKGGAPADAMVGLATGELGGGVIAGGASPVSIATGTGAAIGTAAGAGFGRNWVMPAAGIVSAVGGILTSLAPYFGPFGLAGAAAGSILNGLSGAVLSSFQHVANRILVNADTILTNKVHNLETVTKELDAQQDIVKKLLKDSIDGDKKALDNI